jgi:hypothetical protein
MSSIIGWSKRFVIHNGFREEGEGRVNDRMSCSNQGSCMELSEQRSTKSGEELGNDQWSFGQIYMQ